MPPGLMRLPNGKLVPRPTTQGPLLKKPTYSTQPPSNMMVGPRGYSTPRKVHDPFFTVEQFAKNAWDTIGNAEHAANVRARQQAQGRQASFPLTNALVGALGFLGGAAKSYGDALYNSYRNPVGGRWGNRQHPFKNLQEAGRYASDHSLLDVPIWPGALPGLSMMGRVGAIGGKIPWYRQPLVQGAAVRAFKEGYYDPTHPRRR